MSNNELKEYTAFLKTRKALIDGNVDDAVKAFREFQSRKGNTSNVQSSNGFNNKPVLRGIINPRIEFSDLMIEFEHRPKLAYTPMWKFLDMVIDVVYPDRSVSIKSLPTMKGNKVLAIYNGKTIKYIDCIDVVNYFKLSKWDALDLPYTQLDVIKRNTSDMERDLKTTYFYDYFDKSYLFDDGSVMPGDFMTDTHVMLVTQQVVLAHSPVIDVSDYTGGATLGETYYRFNENGSPIRCCIVKVNTNETEGSSDVKYEMAEYHLTRGHRRVCTLNQDVSKIKDTKYYPADFNYANKYYLPVVVNDIIETMGGLPLKVFDVERNKYNTVTRFKAHVLDNPEQFVHYNGFEEALDFVGFTKQTEHLENNWLGVSKIITDPEKDLLTFIEGDDFVKEYTLFHKDGETFYESFNVEERETLFSIFNIHDRVLIDNNEVSLSVAIDYLSAERKDSKIIRNVTVSPNILNFSKEFNESVVKMFRGKTFSEFPVTVYQNDKIHLLFKGGNGLRWYIVKPNRKGIVLNLSATDSKYKPKQKRYEEMYTSYNIYYNK